MKTHLDRFRLPVLMILSILIAFLSFSSAFSLESNTLYNGCSGDEVREMQEALIRLGYLKGQADGIFGNKTENAVRIFQKKNKLVSDGLAGEKTLGLILSLASQMQENAGKGPDSDEDTPKQSETPASSGTVFSGNYSALRQGSKGERVRSLQQAMIDLGYLSGSPDGIYGNRTRAAVRSFQKNKKLTADGIAGKKTLCAIEAALSSGQAPVSTPMPSSAPVPAADPAEKDVNEKISGPDVSSVHLLHWFDVVKPSISNGQKLLVYDPSSGYSWTLRILARGRHCDAEPLTAKDTRTMISAFNGVNTWNQKPVYVRLPDGRWSLASTHDMPHDSGTVRDNDFNGHLCVHFFRDMEEAQKNDPNYGVANQETIRAWWKKLTGETVP